MDGWYYSPWQYKLRDALREDATETAAFARRIGVPAPVVAGVGAGLFFLAYTPLLQPGPPARRGDQFTLQPISLGGGLIV